ncbi:MAG: MBL fold metallo-hydrolase [Acidobacteriia bacterium]|jgi:glyoxylase-like metal-dependent hydrolase (beta-lactamase superfamily II)|nr:MBL fold metallo-hydrolase [Terriglobia bacterium]
MLVGEIEVLVLTEGYVRLDGGAMFGVVPKPLWEKKIPADARNRIRIAMNCLLIRSGGKQIVVETGAGDKWDHRMRDIYGLEGETRLPELLTARGTPVTDVDLVINTHLHFDHCGWNTRRVNGRTVPTFPRARYVVQRGELEHAKHPTERDRASYLAENFLPVEEAGQFWLLEGDREVAPGVEVLRVPGHTRDMQCVRISSRGQTAFFFADLVPTTAHLPYPWIMGYDLYPLTTLEHKKRLLPQAAQENWLCLFAHDPEVPAARLREQDGRLVAEPVPLD